MARCEHYINLATELDAADNHYLELHDFGLHHYLHPVCQIHILFIYCWYYYILYYSSGYSV